MKEWKILYKKDWPVFLLCLLLGILMPTVMRIYTMSQIHGPMGDEKYAFDEVCHMVLMLTTIMMIFTLESEAYLKQVAGFYLHRRRYVNFRIVQVFVRGLCLAVLLFLAAVFWKQIGLYDGNLIVGTSPGKFEYLGLYGGRGALECSLVCGLTAMLINSLVLMDSGSENPMFSDLTLRKKRKNKCQTQRRKAGSKNRKAIAYFLYFVLFFVNMILVPILVSLKTTIVRYGLYAAMVIACIILLLAAKRKILIKEVPLS